MDNREGLVVDVRLLPANGTGERDAALEMLVSVLGRGRIAVGADLATTPEVSLGKAGSCR